MQTALEIMLVFGILYFAAYQFKKARDNRKRGPGGARQDKDAGKK